MTEQEYRQSIIENTTRLIVELASMIDQGMKNGDIFLACVAGEELAKFIINEDSPLPKILSALAQETYHNKAQMDHAIIVAREDVARVYVDIMGDMELREMLNGD